MKSRHYFESQDRLFSSIPRNVQDFTFVGSNPIRYSGCFELEDPRDFDVDGSTACVLRPNYPGYRRPRPPDRGPSSLSYNNVKHLL